MIGIIFWLLRELLYWYSIVVILAAVFSMLAGFGILDTRNRVVWSIGDFLYRATEPALRPIRNVLPNFGAIDISPLILLLLLQAANMLLAKIYEAIVFNSFRPLF
ncbi:MAG TPA: YggT family protein [Rhodopila sp.]|uniref:YggT family protein n=1 Tax=Rhodopila sp. TaxID=2480087 RepID=UPI002D0E1499|nr:YggT family protein [Rhodopila sp.]HVY14824.1 YggT family protein [Rhodopila sp.]